MPSKLKASSSSLPIIVRRAGLGAESIQTFIYYNLRDKIDALERATSSLEALSQEAVDLIAKTLTQHDPDLRRTLLDIKRDCYNLRSLVKYKKRPDWPAIENEYGHILATVIAAQERVNQCEASFASSYRAQIAREHDALTRLVEDQAFLYGIGLNNPHLLSLLSKLKKCSGRSKGRRVRRAEQTLLRYATRATTKLSPYSTLTTLSIGTVSETPSPIHIGVSGVSGHHLLLAERSLLTPYEAVLFAHLKLQPFWYLVLNDTCEETAPGQYCFLRFGQWQIDPETSRFSYRRTRQVTAQIGGPLPSMVSSLLRKREIRFGEVVKHLQGRLETCGTKADPDSIGNALRKLVDLGFLGRLPPWPTNSPRLEKEIHDLLVEHPEEEDLQRAASALAKFLQLSTRDLTLEAAAPAIQASHNALRRSLVELRSLSTSELKHDPQTLLFSNVFKAKKQFKKDSIAGKSPYLMNALVMSDLVAAANLIFRYATLYNHRHDVLHAIEAIWNERWPDRASIGFLELYRAATKLWNDYLRFDRTERYVPLSSFNPSSLPEIEKLCSLRRRLFSEVNRAMTESDTGLTIDKVRFEEFLAQIPLRYAPCSGVSLFVQPANTNGSLWVLNRLFEGTGRYLTRYPQLMEQRLSEDFVEYFASRSCWQMEGQPTYLLDLQFTEGIMSNAHSSMTHRVLEVPGERCDLEPANVVRLSDLRVVKDEKSGRLHIESLQGERLLPVHMSSSNFIFLPPLLRFLAVFGPYETRQIFPRPEPISTDSLSIVERLRLGSLVVQRKRWTIPLASLSNPPFGPKLSGKSCEENYRAIQQWRRQIGLPREVFVYEPMHGEESGPKSYKPQYLNLTSPTMCNLFQAITRSASEDLIIAETLPRGGDYPLHPDGTRRAVEIQIDVTGGPSSIPC